jgi:N-methylhydantoinase B
VNPNSYGVNREGRPFVLVDTNGCGQGGGARTTKDGFDVSNIAGSTNSSIPNVESIEATYPILYLHRGIVTDSGGAGKYRGGVSLAFSNVPYEIDRVRVSLGYVGKTVPAEGLDGGKSGITSEIRLRRNSNIKELMKRQVPSFEDISGQEEVLAQNRGSLIQTDSDVLYFHVQGGGGYGNSLEREPISVHRDVVEGYVSIEKAEEEYGVVISRNSLLLDSEATEGLRSRKRAEGIQMRNRPADQRE